MHDCIVWLVDFLEERFAVQWHCSRLRPQERFDGNLWADIAVMLGQLTTNLVACDTLYHTVSHNKYRGVI